MAMKLDKVVPFGRSFDEYRRMFALDAQDMRGRILGIGDGPASFNAEMTRSGNQVVSLDPLYSFAAAPIREQFYAVVDNIIAQVEATPEDWVWTYHRSPAQLKQHRVEVLERFIADYNAGRATGRYRVGELPELDLDDQVFDLGLCSHFLFLYSEQLSYEFHLASVREMLRVATEVRIFPLLTLLRQPSAYVVPLIRALEAEGFAATITQVDYEFQKGGNQMLSVRRAVTP